MASLDQTLKVGFPVVLALVVIAIVLGVGSNVLDTVQDTQSTQSDLLQTNESRVGNVTLSKAGTPVLGRTNIDNATEIVRNASPSFTVQTRTTHYNLTKDGVFRWINAAGVNQSGEFNITYNYTVFVETLQYNASGKGLQGLDSVSDFQPTIAVVAVAVVILGLLGAGLALGMMMSRNR